MNTITSSLRTILRCLCRPVGAAFVMSLMVCASPAGAQTYTLDYALNGNSAARGAYTIHTANIDSYFGSGGVAVYATYFNASWAPHTTPAKGYPGSFRVYCVDLNHYDTSATNVTANVVPGYAAQYTRDQYAKAAWLYDHYAATSEGADSSSLQLAIWSVLDSTFKVDGSSSVWTKAQSWASGAQNDSRYQATVFAVSPQHSGNPFVQNGQDMMGPACVPEPTSLVLVLVGGLGCLGLCCRRSIAADSDLA